MADQELTAAIGRSYEQSRRTYGAPRIHTCLRNGGLKCSRKRVAQLMKNAGITAQRKPRRVRTTDARHEHAVAGNVLDRQFSARRPDEK
jgi:transposase InsO family protein